VRTAVWHDRAEAANRDLDVIDLRDLRSVVSTADAAAKDEETRALAQALRDGLAGRLETEQASWLAELTATVEVGRIVRALRLSSRPPKAGAPLPPELTTRLADGAAAALTTDAPPERWVAVLEALAFSPVRDKAIPTSLPTELHADVRATIARLATRIPKIAHIFEIEPDRNAPRPKQERRKPRKKPKPTPPRAKRPPRGDRPTDAPSPDATREEAPDAVDTAPAGAADPTDPPPAGAADPAAEPPADAAPTGEAEAVDGPAIDADPADTPPVDAAPEQAPASGDTTAEDVPAVAAPPVETASEPVPEPVSSAADGPGAAPPGEPPSPSD
jgi:hypothetical protein